MPELHTDDTHHVCCHCGHVILIRESHVILANGRLHTDCFDKICPEETAQ